MIQSDEKSRLSQMSELLADFWIKSSPLIRIVLLSLYCLLGIMLYMLLGSLCTVILNQTDSGSVSSFDPYRILILGLVALMVLMTFSVTYFFVALKRDPWSELGIAKSAVWVKSLSVGLLLGILMVSVVVLMLILGDWASLSYNNTDGKVLVMIAGLFCLAFCEEVIFRGILWNWIARRMGTAWALILTSALFGFVHVFNPGLENIALLNIIIAGAIFGLLRVITGDLWMAIGCHWGWNLSLGAILGIPVSGNVFEHSVFRWSTHDDGWMTGAAFGIEASLLSQLVLLFVVFVLGRMIAKKQCNYLCKTRS